MTIDDLSPRDKWSGVRLLGVACAATLTCIAVLNAAVDPYGYFGTPAVPGLTERKPTAFTHDRFLKAGLAARSKADCLLAGNSRIGEGIPNDHAMFADCRQVLDISLAGPNMTETRESVAMAIRSHPATTVVANLDFFSFNALRKSTRGGTDWTFAPDPLSRARTLFAATLVADVTLDSLTTLARQSTTAFYDRTGAVNQSFLSEASLARPTRATFLRGLRGYIFHMLPSPGHDFKVRSAASAPLEDLKRFLSDRQTSRGRTLLFISAPHAWQLELIDALGLWPQWENWKRSVARVNEEVAHDLGREPLPLWDFSGYNAYTTEEVSVDLHATGPLVHYWDTSHFRHSLGARILDHVSGRSITPGFGTRLTTATVEQLLRDTRDARDRWRRDHPQDVEDVRTVVACFAPRDVVVRLQLGKPVDGVCRQLSSLTR
jgi:hypothetical protein